MVRTRHWLASLLLAVLGLAVVAYYTAYLLREDLKDWREVEVVFETVRGLESEDPVRVKGMRVGRVGEIGFFEDQRLVVLQIEPYVELWADARVAIVSEGPTGERAINIQPGTSDAGPLRPGQRLEGVVEAGTGASPLEPGRLDQIHDRIREIDDAVASLLRPSTAGGGLISDRQRAIDLRAFLVQLDQGWLEADQALTQVQRGEGQAGGILGQDAGRRLGAQLRYAREALEKTARGARGVSRGEGTLGGMLGDPARAPDYRQTLRDQALTLRRARRSEGTLGRLVGRDGTAEVVALEDTVGRVAEVTADARQGRGVLGALTSPEAGASLGATIAGLEQGTGRLAAALADREAPWAAHDSLTNLDDALVNIRRGMRTLRRGQPQYTFQGAVLSVF